MLAEQMRHRLRTATTRARSANAVPRPLVGEEIFAGSDYPRTWDAFVGQTRAKAQLKAAAYSARKRQRRMDHVLIASGLAGVGKTSLAKLIAADLGVGLVEVSGAMKVDQAQPILAGMQDNDVLFYDEIHQAMAGGQAKAEWLLQLLQDGKLVLPTGVVHLPDITVVAATTDSQKLPITILGRFPIKPVIEPYTVAEAEYIAQSLATRLGIGTDTPPLPAELWQLIAEASNGNPRDMKALMIALRDSYFVAGGFDVDQALDWAGVTADGLTRLAQDYLLTLLASDKDAVGEKMLTSAMGEPGGLRHTEQLLIQKGLIAVTTNGRSLTEAGVERTGRLAVERGLLADPASDDPNVTRSLRVA